MKNNSIFLFILSGLALLVTAVMLYLTSNQIQRSAIKQNRIDRRIDSMNRANDLVNHLKDSIKIAQDSARFNPVVDHSELK